MRRNLHTVDVAGVGTDGYGPVTTPEGITVPSSNPTDNPTFVDIGGSIYEGRQTPLCDQKLVHVSNGRSIAPTFNLFTDVPVPARFWGLLVDDLNFSADKKSLLYDVRSGRITTSTKWFTIPTAAATPVEVSWRSGTAQEATFRLKGRISQTLTGLNTEAQTGIESVRFGVQGLSRSSSGRRGSLYLDAFVSTRHTVVGP